MKQSIDEKISGLQTKPGEISKISIKDVHNMITKHSIEVGMIAIVPIDSVNPYDEGHFPFGDERWKAVDKRANENNEDAWTEKYHQDGVNLLKKELEEGYIVRPLLVCDGIRRQEVQHAESTMDVTKLRFQRLDGFKRYMVQKEMGCKWITVQIISSHVNNAQMGQSWVL